ncbi:hypothetical protein [Chitinophaga sp. LS1]|uniref:hypothetical protein n=1 Tax=Chitinophaga sp. LS1 TaxID=3051176 RepID=UPI002AAC2B82|nr:hypothetical protein [Chitinophaga sp. LS1]WPV66320.1 hypothetical protein QQL36_31475 [Chitinophaga sp. LS1]
MQLSNSQLIKQHEKLSCILSLAIRAKNKASKAMVEVNRLKASGRAINDIGESIFQIDRAYRDGMYVYQRLMRYYRRQLEKVIGENYIYVNSLATLS